MKRTRIDLGLFFVMALLLIGCTEKKALRSELTNQGGIEYFLGEPFTGIALTHGSGEKINIEEYFKEGKTYKIIFYDNDGNVTSKGEYDENEKMSRIWEEYENGLLKKETEYKNGKYDGSTKFYDSNGQLKYEQVWKDGKRISEKTFK